MMAHVFSVVILAPIATTLRIVSSQVRFFSSTGKDEISCIEKLMWCFVTVYGYKSC